MKKFFKHVLITTLFLFLIHNEVAAADIIVISSNDIIPYNTCVDGIRDSLAEYSISVVNIAEDLDRGSRVVQEQRDDKTQLVIAVGPQAAYALSRTPPKLPLLFCMVLNPAKLLGEDHLYPGVALNIPAALQLRTISTAFPGRKKVGIFFDPQVNQPTLDTFTSLAQQYLLNIVSFPIASANDIPAVINSTRFQIDILLFIPDAKLSSTRVVEYVIKESLRKKIPVVGYNSWFAKNGAMLSYSIDYRALGRQTAFIAKKIIAGTAVQQPRIETPSKINITVNLKTASKLQVTISPMIIREADEVIR